MTLEDEVLFQRFSIISYRSADDVLRDDSSDTRRDQHTGDNGNQGFSGDTQGHGDLPNPD